MKIIIKYVIISFIIFLGSSIIKTYAADVPTTMTGTTEDPSWTTIKTINPTEEVFESILRNHLNFGQSWSVGATPYTLDKIWIKGNKFRNYQFEIQLYEMMSPDITYNELSSNLFLEPQYATTSDSASSQWVIFDVENITLNPNSYYLFKFIDNGNPIFRWFEGDSYALGTASIQKTYIPTKDFSFAIEEHSQGIYAPEMPWWGIILALGSVFLITKFNFSAVRKRILNRK
ncbi:membrane protein [Candidatus Omnitrophus magneticus]|uniref:Membrane protein n=1 Tax=Candidatus Omnitrophus magneticus TaxID=1609969 RepID=A0A0F0CPT2_9BACT|nr:membrane protein [Candidatus Omnitrophus magneticus]